MANVEFSLLVFDRANGLRRPGWQTQKSPAHLSVNLRRRGE